jgi:hypothetical protein
MRFKSAAIPVTVIEKNGSRPLFSIIEREGIPGNTQESGDLPE